MASPWIDSDWAVDAKLKAVSGVVPVVDFEHAQPAPGAMVHAPIDDYFGFGLLKSYTSSPELNCNWPPSRSTALETISLGLLR